MRSAKKNILFIGRPLQSLNQVKILLAAALPPETSILIIQAKDGPDASLKAANQKFDAVILDPQCGRLDEGGFISSYLTNKNTASADLLVIAPSVDWQAPANMDKLAHQVLASPCSDEDLSKTLLIAFSKNSQHPSKQVSAQTNSFAVDARVLNALLKASCFVCSQFGVDPIELKKPELKNPNSPPWIGDIAASIAIQSRLFQGALVISFDESVFLKMVSSMLGEDQPCIGPDNADAIGEVCNMILGNAKPDFTDYEISMSLPSILKKDSPFPSPAGSANLLIPAGTPGGLFYIQVIAYPQTSAA